MCAPTHSKFSFFFNHRALIARSPTFYQTDKEGWMVQRSLTWKSIPQTLYHHRRLLARSWKGRNRYSGVQWNARLNDTYRGPFTPGPMNFAFITRNRHVLLGGEKNERWAGLTRVRIFVNMGMIDWGIER